MMKWVEERHAHVRSRGAELAWRLYHTRARAVRVGRWTLIPIDVFFEADHCHWRFLTAHPEGQHRRPSGRLHAAWNRRKRRCSKRKSFFLPTASMYTATGRTQGGRMQCWHLSCATTGASGARSHCCLGDLLTIWCTNELWTAVRITLHVAFAVTLQSRE